MWGSSCLPSLYSRGWPWAVPNWPWQALGFLHRKAPCKAACRCNNFRHIACLCTWQQRSGVLICSSKYQCSCGCLMSCKCQTWADVPQIACLPAFWDSSRQKLFACAHLPTQIPQVATRPVSVLVYYHGRLRLSHADRLALGCCRHGRHNGVITRIQLWGYTSVMGEIYCGGRGKLCRMCDAAFGACQTTSPGRATL